MCNTCPGFMESFGHLPHHRIPHVTPVQIKRRAPTAHTMLEIIRARWGDTAHKVFFCFALTTNSECAQGAARGVTRDCTEGMTA